MTGKKAEPIWLEVTSTFANVAVAICAVSLGVYVVTAGGFWGAPTPLLLAQIVWLAVLPVASIPLSFKLARELNASGRLTAAQFSRFLPIPTLILIGPALATLTVLVAR